MLSSQKYSQAVKYSACKKLKNTSHFLTTNDLIVSGRILAPEALYWSPPLTDRIRQTHRYKIS